MREGMAGPPLGDLPKNPGGQREPFRANEKNDGGLFAGRGPLFFQREMLLPLPPVLRRSLAIEQTHGRRRVHGTIPAMKEFFKFGTRAVAIDANLAPAIG